MISRNSASLSWTPPRQVPAMVASTREMRVEPRRCPRPEVPGRGMNLRFGGPLRFFPPHHKKYDSRQDRDPSGHGR